MCNVDATNPDESIHLASVGAELNLNLGVLSWDSPYRFRVGVASPTHEWSAVWAATVQVYVVAGVSF